MLLNLLELPVDEAAVPGVLASEHVCTATYLYASVLCPIAVLCRWKAASSSQRLAPLLLACGVPAGQPGEYNITFSITNSAGLTASVVRKLVVKAACPQSEFLCPDKVQ